MNEHNGDYPTETVECPRCDGCGSAEYECQFGLNATFDTCTYCGGRGEIEVCANCLDDLDGCSVCNPAETIA